ncbi:MAG: cell division protein FtsL [Pseudomonadota bacterium]
MTRLNLVLLIAVLASALYLVRMQYESRRLFVELEKSAAQSRKLEAENERLQVEKRAQATPLRVEKLAKENLQMRTATPAITQYATASSAPKAAASVPVAEKKSAVPVKQGVTP